MFTSKGKPEMTPALPEPSQKRFAPSRMMTSIIANGVRIVGSIEAEGAELQVDGEIDGNVKGGSVTIGDTGLVKGDIISESVLVNGRIEGSVRARKVQLAKNANVRGDIIHQQLAVEMGAVFEGQCRYMQDPLKGDLPISAMGQIGQHSSSSDDNVVGGVVVTGAS